MPNPTPTEQARLDKIEAELADLAKQAEPLRRERDNIRAAIRMRRYRERQ